VRVWTFLLMSLILSGCATKHARLEAFVDEDIQHVVTEYGPPQVAYDMGKQERDFQWVVNTSESHSYPVSTGALIKTNQQFEPNSQKRIITPTFNGRPVKSGCLYTFKTQWDDDTKSWIVMSYQKPTSGC
jgi:hypothetical protein